MVARGKALTWLVELRTKVHSFLMDYNVNLAESMNDVTLLCQFSYLAYIFTKMNKHSFFLQGKNLAIFDTSHKVCAFKKKIGYWSECSKTELECFLIMQAFLEEKKLGLQYGYQ